MERIPNSAKATHLEEYPLSVTRNSTKIYSVIAATDESIVKSVQTLKTTTPQKEKYFFSKEKEELASLLIGIITTQLTQCVLAIVWDSVLAESLLTDSILLLPNVKQVCHMQIWL